MPFVVVTLLTRLSKRDTALFDAASDLGASEGRIFRQILLPLLTPGLIAAWLLSFTLSFDDVVISSFVTGPSYQILPLYIFSQVKMGVTPELNALCSVILILTIGLALVAQRALKRR